MEKFIAGIGPMMMKEIRYGESGKALMNSNLHQQLLFEVSLFH